MLYPETKTLTRFETLAPHESLCVRPRRLRRTENLRALVQETHVRVQQLVTPLFVVHGQNIRAEIPALPDVFHLSLDELAREIETLSELKISSVLLFGLPATKDEIGSENFDARGIVASAIRVVKNVNPEIVVMTDVCMCQYTTHGHCGILHGENVDNDATLEYLARAAIAHADAGADMVAPSAMMDGQVGAIRRALDANGFSDVAIMAYAAKYASAFYGPFRQAADSKPQFGNRKQYQMNPANAREALREIELDIEQGADVVMIKPALAYLDVIRQARDAFRVPIAAYHVSGEYAMLKAAAHNGWLDEKRAALEVLTSIRRAGADILITYFAKAFAQWQRD